MAEVTGLRNDALGDIPVYGVPYGLVYPLLDADGDLVTGATTPDAEVSLNGDTFADCTNESTEIATNSGVYYLLLTAAEMTADVVTVIAKSATAGMKTTVMTLYPRKLVTLRAGTVGANAADGTTLQLDSSAVAIDDYYNGCLLVGTLDSNVEARMISDYVGSTKVCTVSPAFVTTPDNNDTFVVYLPPGGKQVMQADAVGFGAVAGTFASGIPAVNTTQIEGSDATNQIRDAVVDDATRIDASALNTLSGHDPGETIMGATDLGTGSGLTSLATAANLATVAGYLDTEIADIKAKTDNLPSDPADASVVAGLIAAVETKVDDIPTNAELATALGTADDAVLAQVALVKAKTDLIPADPADASDIAAAFSTTNGKVDAVKAVVDDILVDTGTTLQGELDGIQADTEDIQSRLPAALTGDGNIKADALKFEGADPSDTINAQADLALSDYDPPTRTEATSDKAENLTAVGDVPTNAELATALAAADDAVIAAIAALSIPTASQNAVAVLTTQMTESYHADGAAPTLAQALCFLIASLTEFSISGVTITAKKLDGSTTAATFTLDDASDPTSRTRAS